MTGAIEEKRGNGRPSANGTSGAAEAATDRESAAPKGAGRRYVMVGGAALVLALGVGGYMLATQGTESTDDAQVSADIVPIGTRVAGQIVKVHIQENQLVKKGDPIADIDDADYTAREKQAEAELATANAQAAAADA